MKKLIVKIVTLIFSVTVVLSMFTACNWVTTVVDRDMNQVVATVNISRNTTDESLKGKLNDDKIYKRDLVAGYMSYGYQYVTSQNYTQSAAYKVVFDNLVSNKVITQLARYELSKDNPDVTLKYDVNADKTGLNADYVQHLKSYLTDYEFANALYLVRSSVNSMVTTFVETTDDTDEKEDESFTARTTPTKDSDEDTDEEALKARTATEYEIKVVEATLEYDEAENVPEEFTTLVASNPSVYDLNMYLFMNYEIDFASSRERKQGASKLFDYLENNGLNKEGDRWATKESERKSDKEKYYDFNNPDESLNCTYFQYLLETRLESALISKYENSLINSIEETELSNDGLWEQYVVEYATQEALYRNDITSYETALSNVSDSSFILYTPYEGSYGYVTNLLIGFSDEQTALLNAYSSKKGVTEADIVNYRKGLLQSLQASDQRTTWVQSNYGKYSNVADNSGTFTFDDDYRMSSLDSVKNFIGTVKVKDAEGTKVEDSNGVKKGAWSYTEVTPDKIDFATFYNTYVKDLLGDVKYFEDGGAYGKATYSDELYDKFNDLLFAFSTDTGCLNKEYGYLYSAFTSDTTYVKEFAEAAKLVVSKGVGAYTVVATQYGYHIIMCTELVKTPYAVNDTGKDAFVQDLANKGTLAYNYREVKKNAVVNNEISKFVERKINPFVTAKNEQYAVSRNDKVYKQLITEPDTEE